MCGITGFYSFKTDRNREEQAAIGRQLGRAIAHRGPDAEDLWQDPDVPLTLCHRRLAIIDLSDAGRQPMHSATGRYVVTYNGEIYNYLSLQKELQDAGVTFKSRSDTEVMLAAFEYWGINQTLQKLNGMFAIALWDRQERQLHFIRDRFGKKPLYVGWAGQDLVFASELKSFHVHSDFQAEIDRNILAQYMQFGYVHAPHCIFKNIWQMKPASRLSIKFDDLSCGEDLSRKMQGYWSLKSVSEHGKNHLSSKSEGEIINEFEMRLQKAVRQRMISDVPFGAFLSGGIDSSTVAALMQQNSKTPIKTYSIGFNEVEYNEAKHAKAIARHLGTDHQEFYIQPQDALDVIPEMSDIYDEPFADSSQIPTFLVSEMARQEVTVVLTGDGGDEILGGYDRHTKLSAVWSVMKWMPQPVRQAFYAAIKTVPDFYINQFTPENPNFAAQVKRTFRALGHKDTQKIYEALLTHWSSKKQVVLNGVAPLSDLDQPSKWPQNLNFVDSMIYADLKIYRPHDLMVKTDRASMAVGLEARAPLMDYRLAEYCWTLPHAMKIRGKQGKYLLRQVLSHHVPESLYDRPKMGFSVPIGDWLRGPLKAWGDDLLSPERLNAQGLFNPDVITKAWNSFQKSHSREVPKHLWTALMFQSWYDRWIA
ncbi:MAG: asparagine synthase (glutamine-hydrolyzing) [Alphaproteobacteria bacterium]